MLRAHDGIQIIQFMSSDALPHLRQYLIDNDKILVACTNIMYYIVSPAIKGKSRYAPS